MKLVGIFVLGPLDYLFGFLPEPPDPFVWTIPWPGWLPSWVASYTLTAVIAAGLLFLLVRTVRWVYGLIPVVQ
jgi:hypothetical protein